ncbi:hypothetical protein OA490_03370 [Flavobacteriales bacterium]|nr:hypothetical protein [Flavobacteriales bacterium]
MKNLLTVIKIFFLCSSYSQNLTKDINLSKKIDETSGLEIVDGQFITHNDSGGDPKLYYLDKNGKIVKERKIEGVKNHDWEDLTKDDKFIYVADMGNNYDTRKNLSIIKIPIDKSSNENPEIINFLYPEQKKFKRIYRRSEYDAEALISFGDILLIFTKNKRKKITEIYSLPKYGGNFQAQKIGSLNTESIVTGADYDKKTNTLVLTSTINFDEYYILLINDFSLNNKDHKINMYEIPIGKTQVEAIKIIDENTFWITSEDESSSSSARLMKIKL